jgi:hypothetical protein
MFNIIMATLLFLFGPSSQTTKLDGTWKMTVETSAGSGTPTFDLKQTSDTEFTGTYHGQLGDLPVKGKRDGNKISMTFEVQGMAVEYSGTVDGDNMQGIVKLGTMGDGKFTGKRG